MSRAGSKTKADGNKGEISLDIANSLWGQRGTAWEQPFLDELARWFGAGMNLVDYVGAAEPARVRINDWTAAATHDKIRDLVPAWDTAIVLYDAGGADMRASLPRAYPCRSKTPRRGPVCPPSTRRCCVSAWATRRRGIHYA